MILLGDFNTEAPDGAAYKILLDAGYIDLWQMGSEGTGNTCCQAPLLQNETSELYARIDQIFVRNLELPTSVMTHTIGDTAAERLPFRVMALRPCRRCCIFDDTSVVAIKNRVESP